MYDELPEIQNWKPYWGTNEDAEIIHFHGPKPPHAKALMDNNGDLLPEVLKELYQRDTVYYREITSLWYAILAEATR